MPPFRVIPFPCGRLTRLQKELQHTLTPSRNILLDQVLDVCCWWTPACYSSSLRIPLWTLLEDADFPEESLGD